MKAQTSPKAYRTPDTGHGSFPRTRILNLSEMYQKTLGQKFPASSFIPSQLVQSNRATVKPG